MKLSVITVSWKVRDKLKVNLEELFKSRTDFNWEVFVVDNNSADGTAEMIRSEFPRVRLIVNDDNFGFARANNQALQQVTGDFILLLNPDMKVNSQTLRQTVAWLQNNPQAWVAGGRLIDEADKNIASVRRFPALTDQLAIVLKLPHLFSKILNKYLCVDFDYGQAAKVDSVRGSFFAIRRSALEKVGLLDERFFIWFEEVDYCRRVYAAGGEVWYTPAASCLDLVGASFKQLPRGRAQRYFRNSQLKYFVKWHGLGRAGLLAAAWLPVLLFLPLAKVFKISGRAKT